MYVNKKSSTTRWKTGYFVQELQVYETKQSVINNDLIKDNYKQ